MGSVLTQTLVASARAVRLARRGAEFGFDAGELRVDMARVKARKDAIVPQSRDRLEAWLRGLPAYGSARRTESPTERPSRRR